MRARNDNQLTRSTFRLLPSARPATTHPTKAYAAAMAEDVIMDESYVLVWADKEVPCIVVQLRAFANRDQFKQLMAAGLAYYQTQSRPTRRWGWIADTRNMSAIPQEVQQWLAEEWNEQAYRTGLREMSIVTSANIMGQLATQQYVQRAMAQTDKYILEPVHYPYLEAAKQSVTKRCAALNK